ncbi:hypothetical protein [Paractinoplanes rishiriensis]|uniref:Uncharacterized protein n=1 Tax=Paractinoplanes rishiriensis TaxID=1050105 RepID=A0A919KAA6_9ACTN|nr:hypothetical protein [Actinoplanes rishiriensis]GIF01771.1 hypothetical protein Ari01nite_92350 [Actinoplanes rishiriensis]
MSTGTAHNGPIEIAFEVEGPVSGYGLPDMVRVFRVIGSTGYPRDDQWIRDAAVRSFDQAHDPDGVRRQLAAIMTATDRRPMLRQLVVFTGMGHDLPAALQPVIADEIAGICRKERPS